MANAYISEELPLELWSRVLARVRDDYAHLTVELTDKLMPRAATVDHGLAAIAQVAATRTDALHRIAVLENLQLLALELDLQLQQAVFSVGIPDLACRVETLRALEALYLTNFRGLPSRNSAEQAMAEAVGQLNALRNAGHGEQTNAERQRLRDVTHVLLVLGREDTEQYVQSAREVRATCDDLDARRQALMLTTKLAMHLSPTLAELLADYGVKGQLSAPAESVEQPPEPMAGSVEQPAKTLPPASAA